MKQQKLSITETLLYTEIVDLAKIGEKFGYCWAYNSYFSYLLHISTRHIQRNLHALAKKQLIEIIFLNNRRIIRFLRKKAR